MDVVCTIDEYIIYVCTISKMCRLYIVLDMIFIDTYFSHPVFPSSRPRVNKLEIISASILVNKRPTANILRHCFRNLFSYTTNACFAVHKKLNYN